MGAVEGRWGGSGVQWVLWEEDEEGLRVWGVWWEDEEGLGIWCVRWEDEEGLVSVVGG